jgi:formate hydrogenlyase subunit 6/NADH:ubiquinone oxidoreductase subunit I
MAAYPEFRPASCVRYRYRYSECRRCADACPTQAVTLTDEGVVLDPARCHNCALCTSACRTEALVSGNLRRVDLLRRAIKQPKIVLACAPSGAEAAEVVPCLGALDPAMLSFLAKRGITVELTGSEHCEQCHYAPHGRAQLELNLAALEILRKSAGAEKWAETRVLRKEGAHAKRGAGERHDASRRQLFRRFVGRGVDQVFHAGPDACAPVPQKAIRIAAPFSTAQRELLQALWPAGEERRAGAATIATHPVLPLAQLQLQLGCTACEACARVCPTGALQVSEGPRAWSLVFKASHCVACDVCLEACQPRVLRSLDTISLAALVETKPVEMHVLPKLRCSRCDRFFVRMGSSENCPVCEGDDADFASIFG